MSQGEQGRDGPFDDGPSFDEQLENFERQERERRAQQSAPEVNWNGSKRSRLGRFVRKSVTFFATVFLIGSISGLASAAGITPPGLIGAVPVLGPYLATSAAGWLLTIPFWAAVAWFSLKL